MRNLIIIPSTILKLLKVVYYLPFALFFALANIVKIIRICKGFINRTIFIDFAIDEILEQAPPLFIVHVFSISFYLTIILWILLF